jgi:MYXO-CTERM domain-containing protein
VDQLRYNLVPEPGMLGVAAIGAVALLRRRRD